MDKTQVELVKRKQAEFLKKYNPEKSLDTAVSKSISAAVQHNSLYAEHVPTKHRAHVRECWALHLTALREKYTKPQTAAFHEAEISSFQARMKDECAHYFRSAPHPKYFYDHGFRISHSQKSIGVYLKHLWCMGEIAEPPQCPVDARILKIAGCKGTDTRWGYVNSIEEHRRKVAILQSVADSEAVTIASWELLKFST